MSDFYSEIVPVSAEEEEVYESIPPNHNRKVTRREENEDEDIVIEEINHSKLQSLNEEFESKVRDKLLYSNRLNGNENKELIKKNRLLRFKFLENELRALMVELKEENQEDEKPLLDKVNKMVGDISSFKLEQDLDSFVNYWDERLKNVCIPNSNDKKVDIFSKTQVSDTSDVELESRIAKLERILESRKTDVSLPDAISDLEMKIEAFLTNKQNLQNFEEEIGTLINNCEEYMNKSKRIHDKSEIVPLTDRKLCFLYEKLKRLPEFSQMSMELVSRLKSLNHIILESTGTIEFMKNLENDFTSIESKLSAWEEKLDSLEDQLALDRDIFNISVLKLSGSNELHKE